MISFFFLFVFVFCFFLLTPEGAAMAYKGYKSMQARREWSKFNASKKSMQWNDKENTLYEGGVEDVGGGGGYSSNKTCYLGRFLDFVSWFLLKGGCFETIGIFTTPRIYHPHPWSFSWSCDHGVFYFSTLAFLFPKFSNFIPRLSTRSTTHTRTRGVQLRN